MSRIHHVWISRVFSWQTVSSPLSVRIAHKICCHFYRTNLEDEFENMQNTRAFTFLNALYIYCFYLRAWNARRGENSRRENNKPRWQIWGLKLTASWQASGELDNRVYQNNSNWFRLADSTFKPISKHCSINFKQTQTLRKRNYSAKFASTFFLHNLKPKFV